jgi:hypothetical protein
MPFENVATLKIEFEVVRIVIPCSLVDAYNRFTQNCYYIVAVLVGVSETL